MQPPVLDVTSSGARRAVGPMNRMIVDLRGNDRLLSTRQKWLCLGQRQPQIGDIGKPGGPIDLHQVDTPWLAVRPHFRPIAKPTSCTSPGRKRPDRSYPFRLYPPNLWTL